MNTTLKQLLQWPPTSSTVIGIGMIGAAVDYLLSGNLTQAMFIAGILKILIPQDATAVGQLQQILGNVPPKMAALVFAAGLSTAALVGCGQFSATGGLAATPVGQALITALVDNLAPGVSTAIGNVEKGLASNKDVQMLAYDLPWAKQALDYFGPAFLSPATIAELDSGIATAQALLADPPADVGSAVATAAAVYQQIVTDLHPALAPAS